MQKRAFFWIIGLLSIAIFSQSCKFRKIERNQDWRVKYEAALQYYEEEDYYKASILFEQILPIVRGLPEGEEVQFYLAYCHYNQGMYLLASHHFQTFYEAYGRSDLVEEARYMYAYSLYADAPGENLDQTSSQEAIVAMQDFLNKYPNSEFSENAGDHIQELQERLERKGYANAYQYYKMKFYTAAVVAFKNFKIEYPDSELVEDADYHKIMAQYQYAQQSIISKQQERFALVKQYYEAFIDRYPDSDYIRTAEKAYENTLDKLAEFAKK